MVRMPTAVPFKNRPPQLSGSCARTRATSGGERQRIAIARAMVLEPTFIMMDEPTSALDMSVQAQIVDLLRDLQREKNLSYLFISHDLKVVRALADEVMVLKDGRVVEQGPATRIFDAPGWACARERLAIVTDTTSYSTAVLP